MTTEADTDVLVVGGGPAGAAAAWQLARSGRRVHLVDKATFPRDKCCGDGLTTAALRHLEAMGLNPAGMPSWRTVDRTRWRSPVGTHVDTTLPNDGVRVAIVRRAELDAAVLDLARSAGASVTEGCAITGIDVALNSISATTSTGVTVRASYLVAADGAWSRTRHLLGASSARYLGEIHAFRQYFTNVTGPARDRLWVGFDGDLLPLYAWSFPLADGTVNVGFGVQRSDGRSVQYMKQLWDELLQRPHMQELFGDAAVPEGAHKAWPIPATLDVGLLTSGNGRVLFVGDAARVPDPLTGEGIGQAIETGRLAARLVHHRFQQPSRVARLYRRQLAWGMRLDHRFSRALLHPLAHGRALDRGMRLAASDRFPTDYLMRWAFEDNPRAALLTPWRWKQRFDKKTGAYT